MKGSMIFLIILIILVSGCAVQPEAVTETGPKGSAKEETLVEEADAETETTSVKEVSLEDLSEHDTEDDCWIVYDGKVYDFSNAGIHPNMAKTFYSHCGKESGFEEGAKARHSNSSEDRVARYGKFVGALK